VYTKQKENNETIESYRKAVELSQKKDKDMAQKIQNKIASLEDKTRIPTQETSLLLIPTVSALSFAVVVARSRPAQAVSNRKRQIATAKLNRYLGKPSPAFQCSDLRVRAIPPLDKSKCHGRFRGRRIEQSSRADSDADNVSRSAYAYIFLILRQCPRSPLMRIDVHPSRRRFAGVKYPRGKIKIGSAIRSQIREKVPRLGPERGSGSLR